MNNSFSKKTIICIFISLSLLSGCRKQTSDVKKSFYSDKENWAFLETETQGKDADVFFIAPTVYLGNEGNLVWKDFDKETKASFVGAINMEKGIYDDNARFFSPFYHQASLSAFYADENASAKVFENAFSEIKEAFEYYMKNYNKNRPFILAGFSQGAQLCIKLLEEYSANKNFNRLFIACYAIGWRFTEEDAKKFPEIKFAQGELDTGVLIAFNSEAPGITESLMIPKGTKTMAINPLNWKTDSTPAQASRNLGACFTNYSGEVIKEIQGFCGASISSDRGALVIADIDPEEYPAYLFPNGIYHIYDYQFFYRNLEKNVQDRIKAFSENQK